MPTLELSTGIQQGNPTVIRQRLVNLQAEPTPQGPYRSIRFSRPRLVTTVVLGAGPIRAAFDFGKVRITVSGVQVYADNTMIGVIPTAGTVRFAVSDEECVATCGGFAYYITTSSVVAINDPDLFRVGDVVVLGGRFLYMSNGDIGGTSGQFAWSDLNNARSIAGLSFASAESQPDPLVGMCVQGERVGMFGSRTVEWWYTTSDPNAPYQRSTGQTYDRGLLAIRSLQNIDNSIYFVGNDRIVYKSGAVPRVVSSYEVAEQIGLLSDANAALITSWTATINQHAYYGINLPGLGTWVFDLGMNSWSQWRSWDRERFRVDGSSAPYLWDAYTGTIMSFVTTPGTDLGVDPIERVCSSFMSVAGGNVNVTLLCLFAKRGVGLEGSGYGSDPVVEMRYSDDDGSYWSEWLEAKLGQKGDTSEVAKAVWLFLGAATAPGRLYEFRCSDPVEFVPYHAVYNELVS